MMKLVPAAGIAGWLIFGDWLPGLALAILAFGWAVLPSTEGPPVLALAFTMQWVSVCIGFFYFLITGRPLEATLHSDYRTMVEIGLGCVVAMALGLRLGRYLIERLGPPTGLRPLHALSAKTLFVVYAVATASVGVVQQIAWNYDGLAQGIFAITYLRLGLVYLIFRRLVLRNDWYYVAGVLVVEIVMGITGFYAGFREPLVMAALAFLEYFDRRNIRHWAMLTAVGVAMTVLGVVWIGVRTDYRVRWQENERFQENRSARIDLLRESISHWASQDWFELSSTVDHFVERLWTVYYPALAVERVPSSIPHTDGKLMIDTLEFVFMPRLLFPDKPEIKSDSLMVRQYSGVQVAGADQQTDIAFGYAAESYIDFGVPMMFVPIFVWGTFIGAACALILREFRHRDIAVAVFTVIGWLSLYLFERSWAKTIGLGGTLMIYAGGLCYLLDRLWFEKFRNLYDGGVDNDGSEIEFAPEATAPLRLHPQTQK